MIVTERPVTSPEESEAESETGIDHPRVYGPDPREVGWSSLTDREDDGEPRRAGWRFRWRSATGASLILLAGGLVVGGAVLQKPGDPVPVDPEYGRMEALGKRLTLEVKQALSGYYGASALDERLAFVCEPQRVRPLMEDHEVSHPPETREVVRVEVHATMTRFNTRFPHLFASVVDSRNQVSTAILRQYPEGVRIDWEAQEAYNPLDLRNTIRLHSSADTTVRVMARPSDYYNFEFIDQEKWQAFVLWNPNEEGTFLHGYCLRGGEVCQALLDLTAGGHAVAARLVVGFSGELNGDDTVEIREIAAPHWFGGDA